MEIAIIIFLILVILVQFITINQKTDGIQELTNKNFKLTGSYSELLRNYELQKLNIENLNSKINKLLENKDRDIKAARIDSVVTQKAVIKGKISEEIAPLLPGWKWNLSDARFYGSPIDYLILDGLSEDNITQLIFVDVKTNKAVLTKRQRQIRDCIRDGRISWETFNIDKK